MLKNESICFGSVCRSVTLKLLSIRMHMLTKCGFEFHEAKDI